MSGGQQLMSRDAGRFVDDRTLVWYRHLDAPPERVWTAISTVDGLRQWWMAGAVHSLDLRPGGLFRHHWTSLVERVDEGRSITIGADEFGSGGHIWAIEPEDDGTRFALVSDYNSAGPAAGYHRMADALVRSVDGVGPEHEEAPLISFYERYLREVGSWRDDLPRRRQAAKDYNAENPNWWLRFAGGSETAGSAVPVADTELDVG